MTDPIRAIDLFAGAGGLSTGLAYACEDLGLEPGVDVELHAINHWEPAIQTHEANHPWAEHYHARIEELYPPNVAEPGTVTLLTGGPECTHFSNARGGKPVSDQKRASAWHVLDWIEKLRPEHVLLENVKEFRSWGPIDGDGKPSKDGSIFDRWVGVLESLGYSVVYDEGAEDYGVVLNAADYGDPQSRERLFILASRSKLPTPPPQTHSDDDDDLPDHRPAASVIDWRDLGSSLWTRDLENPRYQPLATNTMKRIAEGIRRHCADRLAPFADAIERIGPDELRQLRECVVPAEYAPYVAAAVDGPFLVRADGWSNRHSTTFLRGQHTTSRPRDVGDRPLPTVTRGSRGISLATTDAMVLGQHSNSVARDVAGRPTPTVAAGGKLQLAAPQAFCIRQQSGGVPVPTTDPLSTVAVGGAIGLATCDARSLVMPKNHRYRGLHSNALYPAAERPFNTVTTDPRAKLVTPFLHQLTHGGRVYGVDRPMRTVTGANRGEIASVNPYLCPLYPERVNQRPRTRDIDRPLMAVPASKSPAAVATPFLIEYYGNGVSSSVYEPIPTVPTRDRFALCVPEAWPWGLDVRYRMLQPDELKQAQGFPPDYEITGSTKKDRTAQIGNAVPVNLARALVRHLLADETPSLTSYGAGLAEDPDAEVPAYAEVASDDD